MKISVSKQAYDQFNAESQQQLKPVPCDCLLYGVASDQCDQCDGGGVIYEMVLSPEDSAAIQENLRSQGVPLGKIGTQ